MKAKKAITKKITNKVEAPWWAPRDFIKNPIRWGKE